MKLEDYKAALALPEELTFKEALSIRNYLRQTFKRLNSKMDFMHDEEIHDLFDHLNPISEKVISLFKDSIRKPKKSEKGIKNEEARLLKNLKEIKEIDVKIFEKAKCDFNIIITELGRRDWLNGIKFSRQLHIPLRLLNFNAKYFVENLYQTNSQLFHFPYDKFRKKEFEIFVKAIETLKEIKPV